MKIKIRGNKNADETTDITFIIKSTLQCYRATMGKTEHVYQESIRAARTNGDCFSRYC